MNIEIGDPNFRKKLEFDKINILLKIDIWIEKIKNYKK
jgi:hypothetical protein